MGDDSSGTISWQESKFVGAGHGMLHSVCKNGACCFIEGVPVVGTSPMVLLRNHTKCGEMHGSTVAAVGLVEAKLNSTMQVGKCGTVSLQVVQKAVFLCSP